MLILCLYSDIVLVHYLSLCIVSPYALNIPSDRCALDHWTKLEGGGRAGSPRAVTYAEDRPPSTAKSVPYSHIIISSLVRKNEATHGDIAAFVASDCGSWIVR